MVVAAKLPHPECQPGANLEPISHRCYLREVASERDLTKETIYLSLGCLQGGMVPTGRSQAGPITLSESGPP